METREPIQPLADPVLSAGTAVTVPCQANEASPNLLPDEPPPTPLPVTLGAFARATRRRMRLWGFGLAAAVLPNLVPLVSSLWAGQFASSSVLSTLASVAFINMVGFADVLLILRRLERDKVSRFGTGMFACVSGIITGTFTVLANLNPGGLGSGWNGILLGGSLGCLALTGLGEAWLAYKSKQWASLSEG